MMRSSTWLLSLVATLVTAQKPYLPPAFPLTPILPSSIQAAPTVVPNVLDKTAPDAQKVCSGYKASNIKKSANGMTATLNLVGKPCQVYGNDIRELSLAVEYQSKERLAVRIQPSNLSPQDEGVYLLSKNISPQPEADPGASQNASDLRFTWSNEPSFQFKVSRAMTGEVLFDTTGSVLVFEDQYLELRTNMRKEYNVYGLPESLHSFRMGNNFTQTFWNSYYLNNDQQLDVNLHSTHPVYLETRYQNGTSTSHGVYARNAHGQDWLLREDSITYRTIGGSFDLYFLSGPSAKSVIAQYQTQIVQTPVLPAYWHLGFFQTRWGYLSWTNLQDVVDAYAAAGLQLEAVMTDLDYLDRNRIFTNSPGHYNPAEGKKFLDKLHAAGQYYLPILNPEVYVPNKSEHYEPYVRGKELDVFIKDGRSAETYIGVAWSGFAAFIDFLAPQAQQYWTEQFLNYYKTNAYDGFWLDISDPTSWCTGDCGKGKTEMNPIHVPFPLPGDPNTVQAVNYEYPEGFNVTNATEAASASAALASQSAAYPMMMPSSAPLPRTMPQPGVRNLTFPPYAIANMALKSHSLVEQVVGPDAFHRDQYNSTEYALHNVYGHVSGRASYNALLQVHPGKRPWFLSRSTFPGSGNFSGHWGGDTNSNFADMYQGISQALRFSIAGIPMFGVDTGGLNGNADMELITRWQQLSAWYPFYRNHNNRNTIPQEPYRWATTIEATKRILNIRYTLLPYTYTLFHRANVAGETVLRALAWEFPNDESLKAVETQFMSGPAILVTPVLEPLVTTVKGVFPGVAEGTIWYDWYSLVPENVRAGENKTLPAPLVHQPIHIRGGYILPLQKAENTTATSRKNPWSLLVALDQNQKAEGELYLDDGISLKPQATKNVRLLYKNDTLYSKATGNYNDGLPLANLTIAGFGNSPKGVDVSHGGRQQDCGGVKWHVENRALYITGLETATDGGVWNQDFSIHITR